MKKSKTIKFKEIKIFLKKLPKKLAEKAFSTFLGLFLLSLIFSSLIFYSYSIVPKKEILESVKAGLEFKSETYQEILQVWQNREEQFEQTDTKQYPDLFVR